jgi:hypothetical protein
MSTWRKFQRSLARLADRVNLPTGVPADGRSVGLGLATALEAQRRADRPSDEEIERFLRGASGRGDLAKL